MGNLLYTETPVGDSVAMQKSPSNEFATTPQGYQETSRSRSRKKPYFNLENQELYEPLSGDEQDILEPMQIEEDHNEFVESSHDDESSNENFNDFNKQQDVQMHDDSIERGIKFAASQISTVERERYVRAKQKRVKEKFENNSYSNMKILKSG
ncbi:10744_t:CDS:1 [Dentiscutata heterogama]|uniref:10744_t:CDS:1 n=1 Tax=Dentiscutata heterogama TaxID=1316150 RepID=A0ACA9JZN3_9GLOM|nr:10744_t:CDS:1 [Dentiscutata heterogama]